MTTNAQDYAAAKAHRLMREAQDLLDAGFPTKAAQKRAFDCLNRAYGYTKDIVHGLVIDDARMSHPDWQTNEDAFRAYRASLDANDLPFDLHLVKPGHIAIASAFAPASSMIIAELVEMRALVKATPITPIVKDETKARVEQVRKSLVDLMAQRKAQYVEALDMAREFNGLPVSVNAHWVRHEQGTVYLRHYFYLRGKLTPLQVLLAAADTYARETEKA